MVSPRRRRGSPPRHNAPGRRLRDDHRRDGRPRRDTSSRNRPVAATTEQTIASASPQAPNPTGLAERYALALLALADERRQADPGITERVAADLDRLFALWRDDATFRAFVGDPRLDAGAQRRGAF